MEELSYCTRTQFTTCANHSHFLIIGGKWKTNGWVKDCDDCYMCQSPLVSRCSLTWQLSCQWCKVCILNTDLKVTRSYANYSYYITYCIFNFHFVIHVIWKSLIKCMIMQPRTGYYWAIHPPVLSETEETLFQRRSSATPTPSSATWGACL